MAEGIIKGSEISTLKMYEVVRITLLELLKGYPAHVYYGIFEGRFEKGIGEEVVRILEKHKLLEFEDVLINNQMIKSYRLTPKGIDVAVSLAQLKYAEGMNFFTIMIIVISTLTLIVGLNSLFFNLL